MIKVTWSHVVGAVPCAVPPQGAVDVVVAVAVVAGAVRMDAATNAAAETGIQERIGITSGCRHRV